MSSPFQRAFSSKSPLNEIKISQKELNDPKSASSEPAAKLENTEGQGGFDYEKQKGEMNFAGDDGYDTLENSMDAVPKKKTESVAKMKSPLNGSYYQPQGEVYLSDQPAFQEMQGKIQAAADQVMSNWTDEDQETKLSNRIARRGDREKIRNERKKLVSFGPDGKLLKGDARENFADKVTFDENEFLEDGKTANPNFGEITGGSKKARKFYAKTQELKDRKTDVTNKITAAMRDYEKDKILFGSTPEGIKKLNSKYPQGPPRTKKKKKNYAQRTLRPIYR